MATSQGRDRIVIGVDFGTTFSGVAEAYSGTPTTADEVNVIKTWPGGNNVTSDKVPSEIAYEKNKGASHSTPGAKDVDGWSSFIPELADVKEEKPAVGDRNAGSKVRWGFQLRPDESRLRCMKLMLDPNQELKLPNFVSQLEMREQLAKSGKGASVVVADYLRELYKHAKYELVKKYGTLFVETTDLQWILTVPAVWSDRAKDATLTAAKSAGMGPDVTLISEPEAAAVYTLQAIQPNHLHEGDNFVVVDAGGGTVDLISYEIKQIRPLRIEESAQGSGACCGAALLNMKFEEHVKSRMGAAAFDYIRREKSKTWLTAMKYFEDYVKRNFDPDERTDFNVPMPAIEDNEEMGVEQGFLTVTSGDVARMFGPIVVEIIGLVEQQISSLRENKKTVAGIVLVGGFGQSRCMYHALKRKFGNENPLKRKLGDEAGKTGKNNVEVMQPANAWTAVVRGAVLRGLEGTELVLSRRSRRHYGSSCDPTFDPQIHPASCKKWDPLDEEFRARDRIKWFIRKGQKITSNEPVLLPFFRTFESRQSRTVIETLRVCDEDNAPDGEDESTRILCSMMVDLSKVPAKHWKQRYTSLYRPFKRLDYQLGMQLESGGLKFDLRVDGVVYGDVVAKFD